MPYISVKTPFRTEKQAAEKMKAEFGKAIELLPGKTERWLMVSFDSQDEMFFAGSSSPSAIAEISVFGKAKPEYYEKLTAEVCRIISENTDIPPDRIYVKYSETDNWGFNGTNF